MPTKVKGGSTKGNNKRSQKPDSFGSSSKAKKPVKPAAKPVQQKPKSSKDLLQRKKKKTYTAEQLGIPQLNGIRPTGVTKPPNAKKGKNFVDDKESMNAIMAMVMAQKEGNIESKMMRARQLEEVREAKKAETEKRAESRKEGLEERKRDIKEKGKAGKKRGRDEGETTGAGDQGKEAEPKTAKKPKKRVSFG